VLPATFSLFEPHFFSSHDGVTHVVRFAKFIEAFQDGQLIPRWMGGVAFGLGSPALMFYGQLAYYAAMIPRLLGASYSFAIEIIFASSVILSAVTFYFWMRDIFGNVPAFMGALFYVWAPYRFLDIYVRGAFPESFAFIFLPLIFISASKLSKTFTKTWFTFGVLSISASILSHNVMALIFLPIYLLYFAVLAGVHRKWRNLLPIIGSLLVSLLLTSYYWVPAFVEKSQVNLDKLNLRSSYQSNFVTLNQIIYSKWGWGELGSGSPMSTQIGLTQLLVTFLAPIFLLLVFTKRKRMSKFILRVLKITRVEVITHITTTQLFHFGIFVLLLVFSVFLMTSSSELLWQKFKLLSFVLYPWRFLALSVFSTAIVASFLVFVLKNNKLLIIGLTLLLLYSNKNHTKLVGVINEQDSYYENFKDTTDMWGEFLPKSADLQLIEECRMEGCTFEKISIPNSVGLVIKEEKSNRLKANYSSENSFIAKINTYYFAGWKIYVDDLVVDDLTVNETGTIDVNLPAGEHKLLVSFENTPLRDITVGVSMITLLSLVGYNLWQKKQV
jgi:hypothetical protein